ncbi:uncharacterized protein LOC142335172 isoform X1 [Convolutriloba macropyga]|uniref:uncharacterized protein LOC142335172 isoform X1 n=1 Tax=Convolutriloba macropyga TaxID=536237 RepID=UPI003F526D89
MSTTTFADGTAKQDNHVESGGGGSGVNKLASKKPRFELMRVELAACWEYSALFGDKLCAICRNQLKETCIECQALSLNGAECTLEKAKCGHMFHFHCIMQWLQARSVCPLCNRAWQGENTRTFFSPNAPNGIGVAHTTSAVGVTPPAPPPAPSTLPVNLQGVAPAMPVLGQSPTDTASLSGGSNPPPLPPRD